VTFTEDQIIANVQLKWVCDPVARSTEVSVSHCNVQGLSSHIHFSVCWTNPPKGGSLPLCSDFRNL